MDWSWIKSGIMAALIVSSMTLASCVEHQTPSPSQPPARLASAFYTSKEGCKVWNDNPKAGETVSWSGQCSGGYAQGMGVVRWESPESWQEYEAKYNAGKQVEKWVWQRRGKNNDSGSAPSAEPGSATASTGSVPPASSPKAGTGDRTGGILQPRLRDLVSFNSYSKFAYRIDENTKEILAWGRTFSDDCGLGDCEAPTIRRIKHITEIPAPVGLYGRYFNELLYVVTAPGDVYVIGGKNSKISKIGGLGNISQVAPGEMNTYFLTKDGAVVTRGTGEDKHIDGLSRIRKITFAMACLFALDQEGILYRYDEKSKAVGSYGKQRFISISGAANYLLCVDTAGAIWGTGKKTALTYVNFHTNLGDASNDGNTANFSLVRVQWSPAIRRPEEIPPASGYTDVKAGNVSSFAVHSNGSVWTWGNATYPRVVPNVRDVVSIANASSDQYQATLFLDGGGRLWGFGLGENVGICTIPDNRATAPIELTEQRIQASFDSLINEDIQKKQSRENEARRITEFNKKQTEMERQASLAPKSSAADAGAQCEHLQNRCLSMCKGKSEKDAFFATSKNKCEDDCYSYHWQCKKNDKIMMDYYWCAAQCRGAKNESFCQDDCKK